MKKKLTKIKKNKKKRLYSLKDLALRFGLDEQGFSYYRNALEEYILTVGEGRMRRYPEAAVPIFEEIAKLRNQGQSLTKIKAYFEANKEKVNPKPPKVAEVIEEEKPTKRKRK